MTLIEKEKVGFLDMKNQEFLFKKKDVKECFERIEFKMVKKFKRASIPIMKIIKEEVGDLK